MKRSIFSILGALVLLTACEKKNPEPEVNPVLYYSNTFAYNVMSTYYLWKDEVASQLKNWGLYDDAVAKVESSRYSADKWTTLYEDYTAFESSVTGNGKSFGLDFGLFWADEAKTRIAAVVNYTYEGGPAQKAELGRGDIILTIDGQEMTKDNYAGLAGKLYEGGSVTLGLLGGRSVTLDAVQMYENPVQTVLTFDNGGKKYGYLHFTGFTLDACKDLEEVFQAFKEEGIQELILDLRYNGGGYAYTATALASMIAPAEVVKAQKVFNRDVYNDLLGDDLDSETLFSDEFSYTSSAGNKMTVKPLEVNPGVSHLWVIVSGNTASASEALICGLKPYMDVTLVGQTTYGKFCGGNLIPAGEWFDSVKRSNPSTTLDCDTGKAALPHWGLYVITSRYADCNGVTLSMPSGIPADVAAQDNPFDGFELGTLAETMLSAVLGSTKADAASISMIPYHKPGFGVLLH
ncbi:MAG: hypothetical protein J6M23_02410 [Bacteroidales bacterium]|nr:hypothetical protein [Bacteroidales bacterium]